MIMKPEYSGSKATVATVVICKSAQENKETK